MLKKKTPKFASLQSQPPLQAHQPKLAGQAPELGCGRGFDGPVRPCKRLLASQRVVRGFGTGFGLTVLMGLVCFGGLVRSWVL